MRPLTPGERLNVAGEVAVFLFGLALTVWLVVLVVAPGCVHPAPPPLVPAIDPNGPELAYPDAGESNPCRAGPGEVSILTPAERRALCLHRVAP